MGLSPADPRGIAHGPGGSGRRGPEDAALLSIRRHGQRRQQDGVARRARQDPPQQRLQTVR